MRFNCIACLLKFHDYASALPNVIKVDLVKVVAEIVLMILLMEATILALVIVFELIRTLE